MYEINISCFHTMVNFGILQGSKKILALPIKRLQGFYYEVILVGVKKSF